jgi:hypothetical protein
VKGARETFLNLPNFSVCGCDSYEVRILKPATHNSLVRQQLRLDWRQQGLNEKRDQRHRREEF